MKFRKIWWNSAKIRNNKIPVTSMLSFSKIWMEICFCTELNLDFWYNTSYTTKTYWRNCVCSSRTEGLV